MIRTIEKKYKLWSLNQCFSSGIALCQGDSLFLLSIIFPKSWNIFVFFIWFSYTPFLECLLYVFFLSFKKTMLCLHLITKIVWSWNHIICCKIHFFLENVLGTLWLDQLVSRPTTYLLSLDFLSIEYWFISSISQKHTFSPLH